MNLYLLPREHQVRLYTEIWSNSENFHLKRKNQIEEKKKKVVKPRYEVSKVLKRETQEFLGVIKKDLGRFLVQAENTRLFVPFKILGDSRNAVELDKVLAQFVRWDPPARIPMCKIIRVLGPSDDPLTDHKGILAKYGLNSSFPEKVLKEANAIPEKVSSKEIKNRIDSRNLFTVTIDPLDARDFDDALSIRKLSEKEWEIGVHIADVSNYVIRGSALDREANKRGNSTYLVGEVVPMLPPRLSNGICSLVEDEERLVKSVFFKISNVGEVLKSKICESVIKSNKRLTYEQASLFLNEDNLEKICMAKPLPADIQVILENL